LEIQRRKLGDEHDNTLESMNALAVVLTKREKYKMAEALFQEALKTRQIKRGGDHPVTLETEHDFGMLKMAQRQYQEAENLLQEAANGRIEKLGLPHPYTKESIRNLIELYEAWNKPDKTTEWQAKLTE
jgi:tetratricopeptide (TPR) repeat protein